MTYIDCYLAPVPLDNRAAYEELARISARVLQECGATRVVECWLDDSGPEASSYHGNEARLPSEHYGTFIRAAGAREGETVVMSFVEWPDKATRDAGMEKVTSDPRMQFGDQPPTFDGRRLIAAGFKPMLDGASEARPLARADAMRQALSGRSGPGWSSSLHGKPAPASVGRSARTSGIAMTPQGAALLARYNRWMNERMFEAAGKLGAPELSADKGAFFGSILGTLNHIAVADTIWLHRFAQHRARFASLGELSDFPRPSSLRQTLASNLAGLLAYRRRLDDLLVRWVAELTPEHLASDLSYANMAGVRSSRKLGDVLQHFFNHQTHHRGQVSTLLFQAGVDVGVTDLLALIPGSDA